MVGFVFAGVFLAVVASYVCTEIQLFRFGARRRVMVGDGFALPIILLANFVSFFVLWTGAAVFLLASGSDRYAEVTVICAVAQALWLAQHLWFYHRNRLRLRYET